MNTFSLDFVRLTFLFKAQVESHLPPYMGSMLRGAMGTIFRRNACMAEKADCKDCMFIRQCEYAYVFKTSHLNAAENTEQHYVPRPFVIKPPLDEKTYYSAGKTFEFELLLIGRGADLLPFFIAAFAEAAQNGFSTGRYPFQLEKVEQNLPEGRQLLWDGGKQLHRQPVLERSRPVKLEGDADRHCITLKLRTPIRMVDRGKLSNELDFVLLMHNIFSRLDLLGRAHGTGCLDLPYEELLDKASRVEIVPEISVLRWEDWQRYSYRQEKSLLMDGLVGRITYQGELEPFMPYLRMAEIFHVGKGTVFGLGNILMYS